MPILAALQEVTEGPGFLVPVFKAYPGDNADCVQVVDASSRVEGFLTCIAERSLIPADPIEIEIGDQAIWAFRGLDNAILVGNSERFRGASAALLQAAMITSHPLIAADFALSFLPVEDAIEVLTSCFSAQGKDQRAAQIWLDTNVLLPALRREVVKWIGEEEAKTTPMLVITHGHVCNVYVPTVVHDRANEILDFRFLAEKFGVSQFYWGSADALHSIPIRRQVPDWRIIGVGDIAVDAFTPPPFLGENLRASPGGEVRVAARGNRFEDTGSVSPQTPQIITAKRNSDLFRPKFDEADVELDDLFHFHHHLMLTSVVTTDKRFVATHDAQLKLRRPRDGNLGLPDAINLPNDNIAWIVPFRPAQRSARSQSAARFTTTSELLRVSTQTIVALGAEIFETAVNSLRIHSLSKNSRCYGLLGLTTSDPFKGVDRLVRETLHSMINAFADVNSARRILMFFPDEIELTSRLQRIRFAGREYDVELKIASPSMAQDRVVGIAIGVDVASPYSKKFRAACLDTLIGFGWKNTHTEHYSQVFEYNNRSLFTWIYEKSDPVGEFFHNMQYETYLQGNNPEDNLIITDRAVSAESAARALQHGWTVVHYSELSERMRRTHGLKVL